MKRSLVFIATVIALASCASSKVEIPEADEVIWQSIEAGTIPGAVLAVVKGDRTVYKKAYGNKSLVPTVEPMTEDVIFDIASITKPVGTAISLMQLVEQGKVDLKAKIGSYIPEFDPDEDITVEELLTHTSGLLNYHGPVRTMNYLGHPERLITFVADSLPRVEKHYRYSCINFLLGKTIVENITGERICDYATEHIFKPLGMKDTFYHPAGEPIEESLYARIAPEYSGDLMLIGDTQDSLARMVCLGNGGNAGIFSTVDDFCRLAVALLNGGKLGGKRILKPETVRLMSMPAAEGRALGWDNSSKSSAVKGDCLSDNLIFHTGYSGTFFLVDFDNNLAIVLFANRLHPADTGYRALKADMAKVSNAVAAALL